jgi:4-amino-4-deoxy-L-arabinose transferase-like glycosyltransferase
LSRARGLLELHADRLIAAALFCGYLSLLLLTTGSLGFMRDEGFYFASARAYGAWFELLAQSPAEALSRAAIDRHWAVNHEHPSLIKSLFALSNRATGGLFADVSTSFRLPGMLLSSLAVAVTFAWGRRHLGRDGALVAALSFAFMPRVFFHAHLACFDMPACAMWLVTAYVYSRALETRSRGWLIAVGLVYGLFLDTKHNSWIFPFALLAHFALTQALPLWRELRAGQSWWRRLPPAWLSMLLLGPLVLFALWPWLWHDTFARLREYALFHLRHDYYNMEFLGRTYWEPPMPRGYAWLMTLATVPLITLVLSAIGAFTALRPAQSSTLSPQSSHSDFVLWGVSILFSYAPWLSTDTPIFGGTKHWLTAYPFLCLLAGVGFVRVKQALLALAPRSRAGLLAAACVLLGPVVMALHAHPFGLSAYTPLVGGAPGAASLGLNRTFWGYTTQSLAPFIDEHAPRRGSVYVHDTAQQSFAMFQEAGRLRRDLRGSLNIATSDIALYHHEPHMARVEHQIWVVYGQSSPDAVVAFDGVPIAWAYQRPRSSPR